MIVSCVNFVYQLTLNILSYRLYLNHVKSVFHQLSKLRVKEMSTAFFKWKPNGLQTKYDLNSITIKYNIKFINHSNISTAIFRVTLIYWYSFRKLHQWNLILTPLVTFKNCCGQPQKWIFKVRCLCVQTYLVT